MLTTVMMSGAELQEEEKRGLPKTQDPGTAGNQTGTKLVPLCQFFLLFSIRWVSQNQMGTFEFWTSHRPALAWQHAIGWKAAMGRGQLSFLIETWL